jgi:hypothetical protein
MDEPRLEGTLAPVGANPNRLLGNADIQVTDYSSIFYDFLINGPCVRHFIPVQSAHALPILTRTHTTDPCWDS